MQIIADIIKNFIQDNKRTATIAAAWLGLFIFFIIFAHIPKYNSVARLKKDLLAMEEQIKLTEAMLGDIQNLGHVLADMQRELSSFEKRLPSREGISSVLSELSKIASACLVDVISMGQEEPVQMKDKNDNPLSLDENKLFKIKIELGLKGTYKELAEYIRKIQSSANLLATIEEVAFAKGEDLTPELDADITLNIYIGEREKRL